MRIVGLDVGERRIGVAVSDVTRTLARPLGVLRSAGLDSDAVQVAADEVARLAHEEDGVASIVVGLPRRLDGTPTGMTPRVEQFARQLEARSAVPVILQERADTTGILVRPSFADYLVDWLIDAAGRPPHDPV